MNSKWPEKYVIGLTGNIATGKSVVRKMLEHLGAYGIDADKLSHRAIARNAPAYQAVIDNFGKWIVKPDGEIDRGRLGKVVFTDPVAMKLLESIIHPLVGQAVDLMIRRSSQRVIVIEAIKLLESDLHLGCSTIWVVNVPMEQQIHRLMDKRGMGRAEALQRIELQSNQNAKLNAAQVVIHNNGSFEETWKQVVNEWNKINLISDARQLDLKSDRNEFVVSHARPRDSAIIADLVTRLSQGTRSMSQDDVMAAFGEKAFLLLQKNGINIGIAGWQVENLVARTTEFFIDPGIELEKGLKILMAEVERASHDLQCEVSLVFLPESLAKLQPVWNSLGYEARTAKNLGIQAWTDAAIESDRPNTSLYFKQLRADRVLRPI